MKNRKKGINIKFHTIDRGPDRHPFCTANTTQIGKEVYYNPKIEIVQCGIMQTYTSLNNKNDKYIVTTAEDKVRGTTTIEGWEHRMVLRERYVINTKTEQLISTYEDDGK